MTHPIGEPAFEDLTARARIRDVALRLFAERGIEGTTIRDIAKEAGVSGGLIRHHFGSKEGLRESCDEHMLDRMMRIKEGMLRGGTRDAGLFLKVHPTVLLGYRYFARAMVDGSPAAATTFDDMVELGEKWLATQSPDHISDPRAYAAVLVAMQAGLLVLHDHVSRALGADVFAPEGSLRMIRAMVDFHSHALLSPELAVQAQAVLDELRAQQPPTAAEPDSAGEGASDDRGDPR